jgi:hypothetical protein
MAGYPGFNGQWGGESPELAAAYSNYNTVGYNQMTPEQLQAAGLYAMPSAFNSSWLVDQTGQSRGRYTPGGANPGGTGQGGTVAGGPGAGGGAGGAGGLGGGGSTTASSGPTRSAETWLNSVLNGQELPYDANTVSSLFGQATDMNAAAEGAQNAQAQTQAAMGGASAYDPSLQNVQRSNMAARQQSNTMAQQQIQSQANQANFGAKMDAAGQLSRFDLANQDRARSAQAQLQSGSQNVYHGTNTGSQPQQSGGGSTSGRIQGYGGVDFQDSSDPLHDSWDWNSQLQNAYNSSAQRGALGAASAQGLSAGWWNKKT